MCHSLSIFAGAFLFCSLGNAINLRDHPGRIGAITSIIQDREPVYPDLPDCIYRNIGYGDSVLATIAAGSINECQAHCRGTAKCNHFTYNLQSKTCFLKTENKKPTESAHDFSGSKDCQITGSAGAPNCVMVDTSYDGESIGSYHVNSFEECVNYCKRIDNCAGYTYELKTKECQLKASTLKTATKPNHLSGPVECIVVGAAGVSSCVMAQVGFKDPSIEIKPYETLEECASRCRTYEGKCAGYTFNHVEKSCHLKEKTERPYFFKNDYSGYVGCHLTGRIGCIQADTGFKDDNVGKIQTNSIDECKLACSRKAGCIGFTYNINTRMCFMKQTTEKPYAYDGDYSATLECNLGSVIPCLNVDFGYTTPTLKTFSGAPNMTACRKECQKYEGCQYYTYNIPTKQCFLKASAAQRKHHVGDRSASVKCLLDGHPPCTSWDWGISQEAVSDTKSDSSVEDCADTCRANSKCNFYTFHQGNAHCFLKSSKESGRRHVGDITNPINCNIV